MYKGNWESDIKFLDKTGLLKPGRDILEIGSGSGWLLQHYKGLGVDILGSEIDENKVIDVKKRLGIKMKHMRGDNLMCEDEEFDMVVSLDVFEHILDTEMHLTEVYRILKPGGTYAIATPNKYTNLPFEVCRTKSFTKYKEHHCSLHSYGELRDVLRRHNFEPTFWDIPVVTTFFKEKVRKQFGSAGVWLAKHFPFDQLPIFMKTNFYVTARKPR